MNGRVDESTINRGPWFLALSEVIVSRSDPVDALQARPPVKIGIEAQNRPNPVAFHYRNMDGIPCRQ